MNPPAATFNWRKQILLYSIMIMLAGLLFSRMILSSALIVFIFVALVHRNFLSQLKDFLSAPVLWSMTILFFIPLASGLWSEDLGNWSEIMRIKLPLLLLPICFVGLKKIGFSDWEKIGWAFIVLILIGSGWSFY